MKQIDSIMDAFLALKDIDDEEVMSMIKPKSKKLEEGRSYGIHSSNADLDEAEDFLNAKSDEVSIEVIDVDADSLDHIKNKEDYVGQGILQCNKCHAKKFIDLDKLVVDADNAELYNVEDECPHCKTASTGFELIGQVGKVASKEEQSAEEPEEIQPEENVEEVPEEGAEEGESEEGAENVPDLGTEENAEASEEEPMEPGSAEPVAVDSEESENAEVEATADNDELPPEDEITFANDYASEKEPEVGTEENSAEEKSEEEPKEEKPKEEEKPKKESLNEDEEDSTDSFLLKDSSKSDMDRFGDEAWMMNKVINAIDDEEALYSDWIYIWPNDCNRAECAYYFADEDDFNELANEFEFIYKKYHDSGLKTDDVNVVKFARLKDNEYGLAPIENNNKPYKEALDKKEVNDDEEENVSLTIADLTDCVMDFTKVEDVQINDCEDDSCKVVYDDVSKAIPADLLKQNVTSFSVGKDILTCNIDCEDEEGDLILADVLNLLDEDFDGKICLVDIGTSENVFTGTKEEALEEFGGCSFKGLDAVKTLIINFGESDLEVEDEEESEEDEEIDVVDDSDDEEEIEIVDDEDSDDEEVEIVDDEDESEDEKEEVSESAENNELDSFMNEIKYMSLDDALACWDDYDFATHPGKGPYKAIEKALRDRFNALRYDIDNDLYIEDIVDNDKYNHYFNNNSKLTECDKPVAEGINREFDDYEDDAFDDYSGNYKGKHHAHRPETDSEEQEFRSHGYSVATSERNLDDLDMDEGLNDYSVEDEEIDDESFADEMDSFIRQISDMNKDEVLDWWNDYGFSDEPGEGDNKEIQDALLARAKKLGIDPYNQDLTADDIEDIFDEVKYESVKVRSLKNRKGLSEAVKTLKNNNKPYFVRRSVKEGYRYDLVEGVCKNCKKADTDEGLLTPSINVPINVSHLIGDNNKFSFLNGIGEEVKGDMRGPVDEINEENELANVNALTNLSDEEMEVLSRVREVSQNIVNAIKDVYDIDVDPRLVVADIVQDLRLVSGTMNVEELADTPMNNATKQMFNDYNNFYDALDQVMQFFGAPALDQTPTARLSRAIQTLNSSNFDEENIYNGIASNSFRQALASGQVPYLPEDQRANLMLGEDCHCESKKVCPKCGKKVCECNKPVNEDLLVVTPAAGEEVAPAAVASEEVAAVDCTAQSATNVMSAYLAANKWLDSVKEAIYRNMNCPFFSSYVHELAHKMPAEFDAFGDILHTTNMEIPYPATAELAQKPNNIQEAFVVIFSTLDAIKAALNEFIKCTDENNHGMSCAAEACLNNIEKEYSMLFRLQAKANECGDDTVTFDKYVMQYVEHKDDLLENVNEGKGKKKSKLGKEVFPAGDPAKNMAAFNHASGADVTAGGVEHGGDGECCGESLEEAKKDEPFDKVLDNLEKIQAHADLVQDAIDSAEQYDDVIKNFKDSKLKNKDEIVSKLEDIKKDELSHLDELKDVSDLLPQMGDIEDEEEIEISNDEEVVAEPEEGKEEVVDLPVESFDEELNEYFRHTYKEALDYVTESGEINEDGSITLRGVISNESVDRDVTFTLTPRKAISESLNGNNSNRILEDAEYDVSNNLSEEVFVFKFEKSPEEAATIEIFADDKTVEDILKAAKKLYHTDTMIDADLIQAAADHEYIENKKFYDKKGMDSSHIKAAILNYRDLRDGRDPIKD